MESAADFDGKAHEMESALVKARKMVSTGCSIIAVVSEKEHGTRETAEIEEAIRKNQEQKSLESHQRAENLNDTDSDRGTISTENAKETVSQIDGLHQHSVLSTIRSHRNGPSEYRRNRMSTEDDNMMDIGGNTSLLKMSASTKDREQELESSVDCTVTADGVASDFIMENARKSVIKTINEISSDCSVSAEIPKGRNQMKEIVGTGNAVREQMEQNSMGIDGAYSENESTNSSKDTVSQIDGQSEDTRNRMSTGTESRGTGMQLIDGGVNMMPNMEDMDQDMELSAGSPVTAHEMKSNFKLKVRNVLASDSTVLAVGSRTSSGTRKEQNAMKINGKAKSPKGNFGEKAVSTESTNETVSQTDDGIHQHSGPSEDRAYVESMDITKSTKIEEKSNGIGIRAESEETRRRIQENENETMFGFGPTGTRETAEMEKAIRKNQEQKSLGKHQRAEDLNDTGSDRGTISSENAKETVSQIDGLYEHSVLSTTRSHHNGPSEYRQNRMSTEDDNTMDNDGNTLEMSALTKDQKQRSYRAPVEFTGIPTESMSRSQVAGQTDNGSVESSRAFGGNQENEKEAVFGFGPTELAVISRAFTVYVLSLPRTRTKEPFTLYFSVVCVCSNESDRNLNRRNPIRNWNHQQILQ